VYKILIPLDGSALAEDALPIAIRAAEEMFGPGGQNAEIQLLRVRPAQRRDLTRRRGALEEPSTVEEAYVKRVCERIAHGTRVAVSYTIRSGPAVETICARARKYRADLIVMATHGRTGVSRAWLGSVADGVVRTSHVPVLLHRAGDKAATVSRSPRHYLVPLDGSPEAEQVLERLLPFLRIPESALTLIRVEAPVPLLVLESTEPNAFMSPAVVDDVLTRQVVAQASQYLQRVAQRLRSQGVSKIETVTELDPHVAHAILQAATTRHADGIAMTTRGRGATRLLLGSVADKILRSTTLPLLLLRPAVQRRAAARLPGAERSVRVRARA
jgi:nucleotide-binding universal stress UspA family protein